MVEGGCLCGAVRYELADVREVALCHCRACRRGSGSAFAAWAEGRATLTRGAVRSFEARAFCERCGTTLWEAANGAHRVHLGTLDEPARLPPRIHLAAHEQVPWLRLADLWPWTESAEPTAEGERTIWRGPADPRVTRESVVTLEEIRKETLRSVLLLDVEGHQRRMVASNA